MTRLVNRGLVARKKDELGDFVKLTVSEHDLYCGAMCAWERDEAHGRQAKDSPAWAIIAAIKAKERRRRYARKPQPAQPPHGSGTAQIGTVASALQFLAQQKPEGDITAQEIVAFLAMPTIPLGVALMHLDALKSSGQYDCILADARR